jgi:hypothetical protein
MGIKGSPDDKYTAKQLADAVADANQRVASGRLKSGQSYATDQFFGILDNEPTNLEHKPADNPPFAWPKNKTHYVDGVNKNTTQAIQRGYMRSLITDPNVDITAKNRRLFFQFNPQAIQRSVSQTPGAMLPLLQSPEQLMQPVPGVSTFGFSLLFNREAEVNQGLNPSNVDSIELPSGKKSLVSEVGVLADLLVLDTITGQGISADLISSLAKRQTDFITQQMAAETAALNDLPEAAKAEALKTYVPTYTYKDKSTTELEDKFKVNIGNSAFLNPLPFRVMFSSLFMVEGIATSVEVNFTKFSQTMVPTQCTVNISMYALYIGFAKKNTFLYDNLVQGAKDTQEQTTKDEEVAKKLTAALKQINFENTKFTQVYYGTKKDGFSVKVNSDRTETYKTQLDKKELKDVRLRITMEAYLHTAVSYTINFTQKTWVEYPLSLDDVFDIPVEKTTSGATLYSTDLSNVLLTERGETIPKKYISFRYRIQLVGSGDTGVDVESKPFHTVPQLNTEIIGYTAVDPTDTSPSVEIKNLIANNIYRNTQ